MSDVKIETPWWNETEIFNLILRVAKAGKLDILNKKLVKIYDAVENGASIEKINEFVSRGKFNGCNVDELIEQAK
jgi:hypothetical protein